MTDKPIKDKDGNNGLKKSKVRNNIKNTFAPHMANEYFSIEGIFLGLKFAHIDEKKLPADVKAKLKKYLGNPKKFTTDDLIKELENE